MVAVKLAKNILTTAEILIKFLQKIKIFMKIYQL